jgi:hypothetical protein
MFAAVSCARVTGCGWLRASDVATCQEVEEARWYVYLDRVSASEWRLDEGQARSCLAEIAERADCAPVDLPESCRTSFVGVVPPGGTCQWRNDCADGHWCSTSTQRCERRAQLGETCERRPCADRSAICVAELGCVGQASLGDPCSAWAPCTLGSCRVDGADGIARCARLDLGEACTTDLECRSQNCGSTVCASNALGQPCRIGPDCGREAYCEAARCVARHGPDARCVESDECLSNVCEDGRCLPHGPGGVCARDEECVSGICGSVVGGYCLAAPTPGAAGPGDRCVASADCAEPLGCLHEQCARRVADHEPCDLGLVCSPTSWCDADTSPARCQPMPREGDDCTRASCSSFDSEQYPLTCVAGRCVAGRLRAGEACDPSMFMPCIGECDPARRTCQRRPL